MIYASERQALPLAVASLMTLPRWTGVFFWRPAGRPGPGEMGDDRKSSVNGLVFIGMSQAEFMKPLRVMALFGAFNPLYRVGADAMLADLVPLNNARRLRFRHQQCRIAFGL
jgi:hypothetical protein